MITCTRVGEKVSIDTVPLHSKLQVGESMTWQVSNLPPDYSVELCFDPTGRAPNGLFKNLGPDVVKKSSGSNVEIYGDSFNPPLAFDPIHPLRNLYRYNIVVRDPKGIVVGSQDPTIDNQGSPPEPADGGQG